MEVISSLEGSRVVPESRGRGNAGVDVKETRGYCRVSLVVGRRSIRKIGLGKEKNLSRVACSHPASYGLRGKPETLVLDKPVVSY